MCVWTCTVPQPCKVVCSLQHRLRMLGAEVYGGLRKPASSLVVPAEAWGRWQRCAGAVVAADMQGLTNAAPEHCKGRAYLVQEGARPPPAQVNQICMDQHTVAWSAAPGGGANAARWQVGAGGWANASCIDPRVIP